MTEKKHYVRVNHFGAEKPNDVIVQARTQRAAMRKALKQVVGDGKFVEFPRATQVWAYIGGGKYIEMGSAEIV